MNSENTSQPRMMGPVYALAAAFGLVLVVVIVLASQVITARANTDDMILARNTYPNIANTRIDSCGLCHTTSIPELNVYGLAYNSGTRKVAWSLVAIESADLDGDGFNNYQELLGLSFPGDPRDYPVTTVPTTGAYPPPPSGTQSPYPAPPTATKVPPTATKVPPTATKVPPTATKVPPTATKVPPTATALPPTATSQAPTETGLPPTATPVPPTATDLPPTATALAPSATPAPPTATEAPPTATEAPPTATKAPPTATKAPPTATKAAPTATKAAPTATKFLPTATKKIAPTKTPSVPRGIRPTRTPKVRPTTRPTPTCSQLVDTNLYQFTLEDLYRHIKRCTPEWKMTGDDWDYRMLLGRLWNLFPGWRIGR